MPAGINTLRHRKFYMAVLKHHCVGSHAAAEMVSGFLKSSSHNLRYIGIDSLARIVHINAKYAAEHQLAVIDCLEDPDDTLKKKTLELLYKMTKPSNVEVGILQTE